MSVATDMSSFCSLEKINLCVILKRYHEIGKLTRLHRLCTMSHSITRMKIRILSQIQTGSIVGPLTIRRHFNQQFGLVARKPAKKPSLTPIMAKRRLV